MREKENWGMVGTLEGNGVGSWSVVWISGESDMEKWRVWWMNEEEEEGFKTFEVLRKRDQNPICSSIIQNLKLLKKFEIHW